MANANAATFDGSTDYLTRGADLTGSADSKLVSGALFFKRNGGVGSAQYIYHNGGGRLIIQFRTTNIIKIQGFNAAASEILNVDTSAITDTASWHSLLFSFDMADTGNRHIYVDDSSDLTVNNYVDDSIEFTRANHAFGGTTSGGTLLNGDLSVLWMDIGQYIDFSTEANRRIFVSSDNKVPQTLADSTDGNVGGLGQPIIFFNTAVPSYESNLGSGGGFTENGTLVSATGPEIASDGTVILRRRRGLANAF